MKFLEHKQELPKICHLSPTGDSTHVKTIMDLIPSTGQRLHVSWFKGISNANFEFGEYWGMGGGGLDTL
jgi:hypothetical protein